MRIISIIPARSGSKRVKDKNIRKLMGIPLMAHTIKHSLKSKLIQRTLVSTDSNKYAKIAIKYGAEVPFLRPKNISKDKSTDLQCFKHCLKYLKSKENFVPDIIVHLRVTYPIRESNVIDNCIKLFFKKKKYHSLRTICKSEDPIEKMWYKRKNNSIYNPITKHNQNHSIADQSLKQSYHQNNCVDILRVKYTITKNKIAGKKILGYEMSHNFDIDYPDDLKAIKKYIGKINYKS
jgi:CMP-N-acetylneuraminic acid synthetase|tara:strand:+ start:7 stop:711 length:705 start_codon:yes stop_codon:yes gene_type:complete